jgi:hypothetical protein
MRSNTKLAQKQRELESFLRLHLVDILPNRIRLKAAMRQVMLLCKMSYDNGYMAKKYKLDKEEVEKANAST